MIQSYKELTVAKYQEIRQIIQDDGGELNIQARILACLNDTDLDSILNLSLSKYNELVVKSSFLLDKPKLDGRIPHRLNINGRECEVTTNVKKLTAAQYIDYQTWTSQEDQDKYLANVLACFVVPKGFTYGDGYDVGEIAEWLGEHLSILDALNICFFFRKKYLESIKLTLTFLELTMKRVSRKERDPEVKGMMKELNGKLTEYRRLLQENGDGLIRLGK